MRIAIVISALLASAGLARAAENVSVHSCELVLEGFHLEHVGMVGQDLLVADLRVDPALVSRGIEDAGFWYRATIYGRNGVREVGPWTAVSATVDAERAPAGRYKVGLRYRDSNGSVEGVFWVRTRDGLTYWLNPGTTTGDFVSMVDGTSNFLFSGDTVARLAAGELPLEVFDPHGCRR